MLRPGQILATCRDKDGETYLLRAPSVSQALACQTYINAVSAENVCITFSGEQLTLEEETQYLTSLEKVFERQNGVVLTLEKDDVVVGMAHLNRDLAGRKRTHHVGIFGISLSKEMRGKGLGRVLMLATLQLAIREVPGLKLVLLDVYEVNLRARRLYESLGFQTYGILPKSILFHEEYIDERRMMLQLTPENASSIREKCESATIVWS